MGRIDVVIPDDLEKQLRQKAAADIGLKKGALSLAVKKALEKWINEK